MAERVPIPTDYDKVTWAASGGTKTDPGASPRATGWVFEQIPGYDEFNWLQNLWGGLLDWLRQLAGREWADMWEGISNTSAQNDQFKVYHSTTGLRPRGQSIFNVTNPATGTGTVNQVATDGQYGYFFGGTGDAYINRIDLAAGGQEQEYAIPTGAASALDADGLYVYYTNSNSGVTGLRVHNRDTLAQVRVGGSEYDHGLIRSNGVWVVGISPNTGSGNMVFYTGLETTVTENKIVTAAAALSGLAIDETQVYSGDVLGNVYAYTLAGTPVNSWTTALPSTTAASVNCLAADGNVVYVGTIEVILSASAPASQSPNGNAVLWALDRTTGAPLWSRDFPSTNSVCVSLAVDQGYLYCYDSQDDTLNVFDIRSPEPSLFHKEENWGTGGLAADGVSILGSDDTDAKIRRSWFLRRGTQSFMRVNGNDPTRQPFHTLALPKNDGV
jgi:hypothetical protein